MLGLADKSKLIHLIGCVFEGKEKESIEKLKDLTDSGLDARNFLNDFLELLYLFGRRINLGPIQKDMFISEGELKLIEKISESLDMQDLSLFWQLTLKTIEDLKIVSSENIALEMFLMQLMHLKKLEDYSDEKIFVQGLAQDSKIEKKKIEDGSDEIKSINFAKEQMKNTEQIKTLDKKELEEENKFQIRSFLDLVKLAEKKKEMQLKYDLERNVKLVKFEEGKIDINFNENLNKNFIKNLSQSLYLWTGKRWIITLSKEQNLKTFHEKKIEKRKEFMNEEKNSKIFKEVTEAFPDADLIDVRTDDE